MVRNHSPILCTFNLASFTHVRHAHISPSRHVLRKQVVLLTRNNHLPPTRKKSFLRMLLFVVIVQCHTFRISVSHASILRSFHVVKQSTSSPPSMSLRTVRSFLPHPVPLIPTCTTCARIPSPRRFGLPSPLISYTYSRRFRIFCNTSFTSSSNPSSLYSFSSSGRDFFSASFLFIVASSLRMRNSSSWALF